MNHAVAIDASVAVKLFVEEEYSNQARDLLKSSWQAGTPVIAPPHFRSEVTNAIYQRLRRSDLTEDEAAEAIRLFLRTEITVFGPLDLYRRAFDFARANDVTSIYDSLYIVLARVLNTELWTADQRLVSRVREATSAVRWIGDYIPSADD
jgi:predicted nucleic acid-binding protein